MVEVSKLRTKLGLYALSYRPTELQWPRVPVDRSQPCFGEHGGRQMRCGSVAQTWELSNVYIASAEDDLI